MRQIDCDVVIIGGGIAGTLAAVAAARGGARTVLAERESYLGGTGYAGLLQHICGLYLNGDTVPADTLNEGLVREVAALLLKYSPRTKIQKIGRVYVLPYEREGLRTVLESLCRNENRLTVMRENAAASIERQGSDIRKVVTISAGVHTVLEPAVVVDCSGNGEAAALAGAESDLAVEHERQLAGYVMQIKGLHDADETLSIKVPYYLARAVNEGRLPYSAKFTTFSLGDNPREGYCKMSVEGVKSPERESRAKRDGSAIHAMLAEALPAFNKSWIADSSLRVVDREGRRIKGDYTLTREDVLQARKFADSVAKNAWPIELWNYEKGTFYEYVPAGNYYEIPFRCLMVKGISNLLTGGRCISVTHEALGSTRVMGACMALGEQAGRAAAYRARNGTYPADIKSFSGNT
ncbi:MAG TPA: FAD-dependent oxidoreductase [Nitrospirota bacterium]|nr:FAD-dependent oxidoreductase [Nitrospirota bacterium]